MASEKLGISINLLPPEFLAQELKSAKFYKIQAIGVGIILIMIFLASMSVALRILQSATLSKIQIKLSDAEKKVLALSNRQASLVLLKNRLSTISQNMEEASKQSSMYSLLDKLIPQGVSITSLSIDKAGNAIVSALVPTSDTLDNMISALTSNESNQDKISQVSIESLSRGRDGIFRISLKISAN